MQYPVQRHRLLPFVKPPLHDTFPSGRLQHTRIRVIDKEGRKKRGRTKKLHQSIFMVAKKNFVSTYVLEAAGTNNDSMRGANQISLSNLTTT